MSEQRGQGTVEYLGVVLLIAVVLGAAVALLEATGLGQQVMAAFQRALCIVTGGPCDDVARARVTSSDQHTDGAEVEVMFLRLGGRDVELVERLADGRVAVTYVEGDRGGLDFGTGAEAHVRWGTHGYAVGSEFRAAVLAEHASGRTWVLPSEAAAAPLIDQVRLEARTRHPHETIPGAPGMVPLPAEVHAPPADESFSEGGGELSLDFLGGSGSAHVGAAQAYGVRVERRTGRRTVYVRTSGVLTAQAGLGFGVGVAGQRATGDRYGITYDRDGRPLDFEVLSALDVTGAASLPLRLARIAGAMHVALSGDSHVETEQHLDLTDPANARLVGAYLRAFGTRGGLGLAARALRDRLASSGTTRLRTYAATASAHEVGADARLGGVGLGGQFGSEDVSRRLLSALVRGPGGAWAPDASCAPGAPAV